MPSPPAERLLRYEGFEEEVGPYRPPCSRTSARGSQLAAGALQDVGLEHQAVRVGLEPAPAVPGHEQRRGGDAREAEAVGQQPARRLQQGVLPRVQSCRRRAGLGGGRQLQLGHYETSALVSV